jgi:hypothetical protein
MGRIEFNMKFSKKYYLYRWFLGWADFISGIIQILTFGIYYPDFSLKMEDKFLTEAEKHRD